MNQKYLVALVKEHDQNKMVCIKAEPHDIAAFLTLHQKAPFIQMDTLHDFPFLTARYGFVDKCYDQNYLIHELLPVLIPMQMGEIKAQKQTYLTNELNLLGYEAPRPDWNCLKDYGVSDEEYNEMEVKSDENEADGNER